MRRDVRMIERGEDFGFALEAGEPIGVARERVGQDLDARPRASASCRGARYTSPMPPAPSWAVTW